MFVGEMQHAKHSNSKNVAIQKYQFPRFHGPFWLSHIDFFYFTSVLASVPVRIEV